MPDSADPQFSAPWRPDGTGAVVIRISGELGVASVAALDQALRDALEQAPLVVVDLGDVGQADDAGVGVVAEAAAQARRDGRYMVLMRASRQLQTRLEAAGAPVLDQIFLPPPEIPLRRSSTPEAVAVDRPGFDPLRNPANDSVASARVMAIPDRQLWLHDDVGRVHRAWLPPGVDPLPAGDVVEVYLDANGHLNGWLAPETGLAVNQRLLDHASGARAGDVDCQSTCLVRWRAAAPALLLAHDERCLTCGGELALVR